MTANFENGIWEVKHSKEEIEEELCCYHLVHFNMRNLSIPKDTFPRRKFWEGARYDSWLVSRNDVVCKVSCDRDVNSGWKVAHGRITFGSDGPISKFESLIEKADTEIGDRWTLLSGITMLKVFIENILREHSRSRWFLIQKILFDRFGVVMILTTMTSLRLLFGVQFWEMAASVSFLHMARLLERPNLLRTSFNSPAPVTIIMTNNQSLGG